MRLPIPVYYGLVLLEGFEEVSSWRRGCLWRPGGPAIDGDEAKMMELKRFMERLGIPSTLKDMGVEVKREHLEAVLKETVAGPDMEHIPYEITEDMVFEAMQKVERI